MSPRLSSLPRSDLSLATCRTMLYLWFIFLRSSWLLELVNELPKKYTCCAGGYGTLDELLEIITWSQLGIHAKPVRDPHPQWWCRIASTFFFNGRFILARGVLLQLPVWHVGKFSVILFRNPSLNHCQRENWFASNRCFPTKEKWPTCPCSHMVELYINPSRWGCLGMLQNPMCCRIPSYLRLKSILGGKVRKFSLMGIVQRAPCGILHNLLLETWRSSHSSGFQNPSLILKWILKHSESVWIGDQL
jgi:hypothetical protein